MGLTEMYKIIIATTLINTIFIMSSIILLSQVSSVYADLFQILMVNILFHYMILSQTEVYVCSKTCSTRAL